LFKHFKRLSSFWIWVGRIAPMAMLTAIGISYAFDLITLIDHLLFATLIVFAIFAFAWWWWTMDTVKALFTMFSTATERFNEVMTELKSLKLDVKDANNRQRNKSTDSKSK